MKNIIALIVGTSSFALTVFANDTFPPFSEGSFTIRIPTNMVGCQFDSNHVVGNNFVYTLTGQIFTNSSGHIQTLAEGFSGTNSDKTTPWKTLTELLAVYQQGVNSNAIAPLYSQGSQSFVDSIYTNASTLTEYKSFATAITGMNVLMGYETTNGFIALTSLSVTNMSTPDVLPFYLTKSGSSYFISSFDSSDARESNIGVFLNTHPITDLLQ